MSIVAISFYLFATAANMAGNEQSPKLAPEVADSILRNQPITIILRKVIEMPDYGVPHLWTWSINSAGQAELTVKTSPKLVDRTPERTTRTKLQLDAEQMAAIRQALRDEKFFHLKDEYGPAFIHGGWCTLTVVAGDLTKTVRYCSTWSWVSYWGEDKAKITKMAPAVRVWLKVCEAADKDREVFTESRDISEAIRALKK